ncbi:hypothetical protein CN395_27920 [Priestia megaterium]|uniref:nucleotidyltransferase domain-containing protein n=1 Tax=Priestia megaterium TaxID=1404 RepID=UPI000BF39022|nr:nucleotidyltransferase domain-containing protein [Priestia megaterium]PEU52187.1 hypothetical protein CN395_27920 [Priestia megaterium]
MINSLEKIEIDEMAILDNLLYKNVKYVYLAGSIMEGFGNKTSDIDVYVIVDGDLELKDPELVRGRSLQNDTHVVNNFIQDGIRYDYEYWTLENWMSIIEKLTKVDLADPELINALSARDYDLLHRLKFSKPIINNENFLEIYRTIDFRKLGLYMASLKSEGYSNLLEDVEGALLSKDAKTAFIMTRLLLEETMTGFLAAHEETNPKQKWLYKKLSNYVKKTNEQEVLVSYMNLLTKPLNVTDDEELIHYVKKGIRFSQKLNVRTQSELLKKGSI